MIFTCQHCKVQFKSYDNKPRKARYCSPEHHNAARRKLSDGIIRLAAVRGGQLLETAKELGVSSSILWRHMHRLGVHKQWQEQRYL